MPADLDALLTHVYVLVDDLLPRRRQRGRPVRISDGELIWSCCAGAGSKTAVDAGQHTESSATKAAKRSR